MPSSENFSYFPKINDDKKKIKEKAIEEAQLWLNVWSKIDKNIRCRYTKNIYETIYDNYICNKLLNEITPHIKRNVQTRFVC